MIFSFLFLFLFLEEVWIEFYVFFCGLEERMRGHTLMKCSGCLGPIWSVEWQVDNWKAQNHAPCILDFRMTTGRLRKGNPINNSPKAVDHHALCLHCCTAVQLFRPSSLWFGNNLYFNVKSNLFYYW